MLLGRRWAIHILEPPVRKKTKHHILWSSTRENPSLFVGQTLGPQWSICTYTLKYMHSVWWTFTNRNLDWRWTNRRTVYNQTRWDLYHRKSKFHISLRVFPPSVGINHIREKKNTFFNTESVKLTGLYRYDVVQNGFWRFPIKYVNRPIFWGIVRSSISSTWLFIANISKAIATSADLEWVFLSDTDSKQQFDLRLFQCPFFSMLISWLCFGPYVEVDATLFFWRRFVLF